tara:strand:+ start:647 stop:838 length:192 start_codon:yes stop_codon:yes gene_type:complete
MRKKAKKRKLEDIDRYIAQCRYCKKDVSSQQSFVAFASKDYAHYQCMKEEDEKQQKDLKHNQE